MKLKKEVKVVLAHIIIITILIILASILAKDSESAYNECLIKNNNDVNYCHKLLE